MTERRQPKWQRGRIRNDVEPRAIAGRDVWLLVGQPSTRVAAENGLPFMGYSTNIAPIGANSRGVAIPSRDVELLARSPADFADEVRMVTYEQWLAGDDGTIAQPAGAATEER